MKHVLILVLMVVVLPVIGMSYIFGPTPLHHFYPPAPPVEEPERERRVLLPWVIWVQDQLPQGSRVVRPHNDTIVGEYRNPTIEGWKEQFFHIREAPQQWGIIGTLSSSYRSMVMYPLYAALPQQDIRENVLFTFQLCLFLTAVFAFLRMDCKRRGGFAS